MIKEIKTKLSPFEIYTIFKDEKNSFILDSGMDFENLGRYSFISSNPFKILKFKNSVENPVKELEKELNKYKVTNDTHLPFIGGAVGYLSYDLFRYIESIKENSVDDINCYDLYFGLYNYVVVIDNLENKTYIATPNFDKENEEKIINNIYEKIKHFEENNKYSIKKDKYEKEVLLKSNFTKEEFEKSVIKIKEHIEEGDIYQANLTQRFTCETEKSSYELYKDLREISKAPFGAFLNFEDFDILSNSPERFIKCIDKNIITSPIKGTRPRGKNKEEDLKLKEELLNSDKDKSELLMIVDLERNDLSKISKINTVKVPEIFKIESYANVHHLVSTVCGELNDDVSLVDIINATFPGGSITGTPKIKAMEIIEKLEPTKRNVYTGSIGYISFCGNMDFNICIRTIIKKDNKVYFQVGGGITYDSNPSDEYQETLDKAKSIIKALGGKYEY